MRTTITAIFILLLLAAAAPAAERVRMASDPDLSPDGTTLAFSWRGDLFTVPVEGGTARRLTRHPGRDHDPKFSPDGRRIAFVGDRGRGAQIQVMPVAGGEPRAVTLDTNGYGLIGWFPDGRRLLVRALTDRSWRRAYRFFAVPVEAPEGGRRPAPEMLFDATGYEGSLSPDARRILLTREGESWWRKGYRGSRASQVWMCDLDTGRCLPILRDGTGARTPLWRPDGGSFLYVGQETGSFNLMRYDLDTGVRTPLTRFPDDSVVRPALSRSGEVVVFRHLFDFYRLRPGADDAPTRIEIEVDEEEVLPDRRRVNLDRATACSFTGDGLEVAFIAGGDLWVMDTVLREPVRITRTPAEESEPVFLPDASAILCLSDYGGRRDVWRVTRADADRPWWRSHEFVFTRLTDDDLVESSLSVSPDASRIAFARTPGDVVVMAPGGGQWREVLTGFTQPRYSWSPDGRWLAIALDDVEFNRDVWIVRSDGLGEPVNVSRHPDDDREPVWSPDGRTLAWVGQRARAEADVCYVRLRLEDEEESDRDRKVEAALKKMEKERKAPGDEKAGAKEAAKEKEAAGPAPVEIDFDRIHERVHRIGIPDVREAGLFWSPDGERLAFTARIDGRRGVYAVTFPDRLRPSLLSTTVGSNPVWGKDRIRWLVSGVPTLTKPGGSSESLKFSVRYDYRQSEKYAAAFDLAWRTMRDRFYDPALNNRDWDAVREKYREAAADAGDRPTFERIVEMMLGELNSSHQGFSASSEPARGYRDEWTLSTAHPGLLFEDGYAGPGWKVREVVRDGPADRTASRIEPGEVVLAVDGARIEAGADPAGYLTVEPGHEFELTVRDAEGGERVVRLRGTTLSTVRGLRYPMWVDACRSRVEERSGGRLGYLHIRGMSWRSFEEFERDLYAAGYGRDGLVIDVRYNGGGFTADHLLTALTQPVHAITVSRGGGPGYPQDRKVYASWSKPIVVLVNQDSFSNAEIFAHAIQTLHRGRLVGVTTAGGVISTGGRRIMDLGWLRTPGRGWFVLGTGEDMELNGAVPNYEIWPEPGDLAKGIDRQLDKAVEVLAADVEAWNRRPRPELRYRSQR